jgi:hypothetical protein
MFSCSPITKIIHLSLIGLAKENEIPEHMMIEGFRWSIGHWTHVGKPNMDRPINMAIHGNRNKEKAAAATTTATATTTTKKNKNIIVVIIITILIINNNNTTSHMFGL